MALRMVLGALLALAVFGGTARAAPFATPHVEIELVSARAAITPGETVTLALRQKVIPGWHTYWRNPGDSGEPTTITAWHMPRGFSAGALAWPAPETIPFTFLVNYGYGGEHLFPISLTVPRNAPIGREVTLAADITWLVCSDICIPEQGSASLTLAVAAQGRDDPIWAARIAAAEAALPKRANVAAHVTPGDPATLSIAAPDVGAIHDAYFFPYSRDAIDHAAPQHPRAGAGGLSFSLKAGAARDLGRGALDGVLTYRTTGGEQRAYEVHATPGPALADTATQAVAFTADFPLAAMLAGAEAPKPLALSVDIWAALALAFLGGLILNIMPCVLPVLTLKALSFAGGVQAGRIRREGVVYLIGVLATFLALAGLLIALRGAGEAVGWGFQLQSPWVSAGLALLFFAIGLNLLGVFEIGGGQGAGASLAARGGDLGAFFTGALAVIAATPCTAPFMAGAIGAALTQSAGTTLAVFASLGLGFGAPLVALSFTPGLIRALPKPGVWMERVRKVLAFPMFAAAVWLAWVLTKQAGAGAALGLLSLATALAFALMASRWGRVWMAIAIAALVITGALAWRPLTGQAVPELLAAEPWSSARVAALRSEGRGVFVNFTADWCVSCQVNEALALSRPRVAAAFAERRIAYLKGDWTNRDGAIAAELAAHGRAGVPLYLYYPPQGEVVVLPQFLTEDAVLDAIGAR